VKKQFVKYRFWQQLWNEISREKWDAGFFQNNEPQFQEYEYFEKEIEI